MRSLARLLYALAVSVVVALASPAAPSAQPVGRICDPCDPKDLRHDLVVNSYWYAFGRRPSDAELSYWMSQPAGDARLAGLDALVAAHLTWLKSAPDEQRQTARRALREALADVPGIDQPAVVQNAVVDMMAGREGGGYRGLVQYLRKPDVRRYYANLAGRASTASTPSSLPAPVAGPAAPAPPKVTVPVLMPGGALAGQGGGPSITVALSQVTPLSATTPLIGNAGAGLTQVTPLSDITSFIGNTGGALSNVTPLTISIGNNFTLPIGNALAGRSIQNLGDDPVVAAFRAALGRDPSREEHDAWTGAGQVLTVDGFRAVLRNPQAKPVRQAMVGAAFQATARRQPSATELERWQAWVGQTGAIFTEVTHTLGASLKQNPPVPASTGRGRPSRGPGLGG